MSNKASRILGISEEKGTITKELIDKVDLSELSSKLTSLLGTPVNLDLTVTSKGYIEVKEVDLISKAGILKATFKKIYIDSTGSKYFEKENILSITLGFRWEYRSMGSNGSTILNAWYNLGTKKWEFKEE